MSYMSGPEFAAPALNGKREVPQPPTSRESISLQESKIRTQDILQALALGQSVIFGD